MSGFVNRSLEPNEFSCGRILVLLMNFLLVHNPPRVVKAALMVDKRKFANNFTSNQIEGYFVFKRLAGFNG